MWCDAIGRWWLHYQGELRGPSGKPWPLPWAVQAEANMDIDELAYRVIGKPTSRP
jgi:hypothetical protein